MPHDKKVRRYASYALDTLEDQIACAAATIEDAYIMAGANDYTAKECVDLAARVVLAAFFGGKDGMATKATIRTDTT